MTKHRCHQCGAWVAIEEYNGALRHCLDCGAENRRKNEKSEATFRRVCAKADEMERARLAQEAKASK